MKKIIKILTFLIIYFITSQSYSQELYPLLDKYGDNGSWKRDVSELAYVSMRCGILYSSLSAYFDVNGTKKEDNDYAKSLSEIGIMFTTKAIAISLVKAKMSEDAIANRIKNISNYYLIKIKENKSLFNNIFEGIIIKDAEFCKNQREFFYSF